MNVYLVRCGFAYRAVYPKTTTDVRDEFIYRLREERYGETWSTPSFREADPKDEDYNPKAIVGDFVSIGGSDFALTARVPHALADMLCQYGELLPIKVGGSITVHWFHCWNVIDAIDVARAKVRRNSDAPDSRIMEIYDYVFDPKKIDSAELFHIPHGSSYVFCTEPFKQRIETLGLTGLDFILRWSDEASGIASLNDRRLRDMDMVSDTTH
jgi:hypothetical protein